MLVQVNKIPQANQEIESANKITAGIDMGGKSWVVDTSLREKRLKVLLLIAQFHPYELFSVCGELGMARHLCGDIRCHRLGSRRQFLN